MKTHAPGSAHAATMKGKVTWHLREDSRWLMDGPPLTEQVWACCARTPEGSECEEFGCGAGHRPRQEQLQSSVGLDATGAVVVSTACAARDGRRPDGQAAACVVRWRPAAAPTTRRLLAVQGHAVRQNVDARVRPPLRQGAEERRPRCRGDRRGRHRARPSASVGLEGAGAARHAEPAPGPSRLVGMRTMLMNQLRAILRSAASFFPQGRRKFETAVGGLLEDPEARVGARIRSPGR